MWPKVTGRSSLNFSFPENYVVAAFNFITATFVILSSRCRKARFLINNHTILGIAKNVV
jgi:hypothetical protein